LGRLRKDGILHLRGIKMQPVFKVGHYYKADAYFGGNSNPIIFKVTKVHDNKRSMNVTVLYATGYSTKSFSEWGNLWHMGTWDDSKEIKKKDLVLELLKLQD